MLFAIDSLTGTVKWSNNIFTNDFVSSNNEGCEVSSSPAIAANGTIFVGSDDGRLYLGSTNGITTQTFNAGASVFTSPALGPDGTVYFGTDEEVSITNTGFFALTNDALKWFFTPYDDPVLDPGGSNNRGNVESSPAIGGDGTLYFTAEGSRFHALSTNGNLQWFVPLQGHAEPDPSPAIGADGTIYITAGNGPFLYALHPDGCMKWVFDASAPPVNLSGGFMTPPALGPDGTAYLTVRSFSGFSTALAVDTNGALKWFVEFTNGDDSAQVVSTPAVAADGTVYVGTLDHNLYAITNSGTNAGIKWAYQTGGAIVSSPVIGENGTVYVGSEDGFLYAVFGSAPLATNSSWPMFRQNPAHTGLMLPSTPPPDDCGAPFVYAGSLTQNDDGTPASFTFIIMATNQGTWNVFASVDLTNWAETGSVSLSGDGFNDTNGLGSFTTNFNSLITNQFYVLASGDCLSNSCRSRVIGFMNMTYAEGTNLVANQLYDVQEDFSLPMNTPNESYQFSFDLGFEVGGTVGILKWNGLGFDATTNEPFGIFATEWLNNDVEGQLHTSLLPGTSFFFTNGSGSSFSFPFVGLIRTQQVFQVQAGANFLAAALPVSGAVTNITGYTAHSGDIIRLWDTNSQVFHSFTNTGSTWSPSNPTVGVGEGFVLVTTNAGTWTNTWNQNFPCSP